MAGEPLPPLIPMDLVHALTRGEVDRDDETAALELDAISDAIRNYCGWHVSPVIEETMTLDGTGGAIAQLPTMRLAEVDRIEDDGDEVTDPEWSRDGTVRKPGHRRWSQKFRGVTAEVHHGFDHPAGLAKIVTEAVAQALNAPAGTASAGEKFGPFEFTGAATIAGTELSLGGAALLKPQLAVLDRYRLERI